MLHDPSHRPVVPEEKEIILTQKEKDVLRRLAFGGYRDDIERKNPGCD